jgi:hypothetical protein
METSLKEIPLAAGQRVGEIEMEASCTVGLPQNVFSYDPEETVCDCKVSELSVIHHTSHLVVKRTPTG